ncbi:MAG: hypothetical protein D6706_12005, partial [Chloroflexi bacterium]
KGSVQSDDYSSGSAGWRLSYPGGSFEATRIFANSELHAAKMVMDEIHATNGTSFVARGVGSLMNSATVAATFSVDIVDPTTGHAQIASVGDIVRLWDVSGSYDIWATVSSVVDNTTYYTYNLTKQSGTDGTVVPAGHPFIVYGQSGDGAVLTTASLSNAPYVTVGTITSTPWAGSNPEHVRIGRLDGLGAYGVIGSNEYGFAAGADLTDNSVGASQIIISNKQVSVRNVDIGLHSGSNKTVEITSGGSVKLGTNVSSASTTGFSFDPSTGNVRIGDSSGNNVLWDQSAGTLTVTPNLSALNADLGTITAGQLQLLSSGALGTNATGLVLDKSGLSYSGETWHLVGLSNESLQVGIRATDGALLAGFGDVILDSDGVTIAVPSTGSPLDRNKINWMDGATPIGTVYSEFVNSLGNVYKYVRVGAGSSVQLSVVENPVGADYIDIGGDVKLTGSLLRSSSSGTQDIGSAGTPFDNIYANTITASTIVGTMTGNEWETSGDATIDANQASTTTTVYV